ncbi:UNVERIFIED_CONTAM: hypothetical protein PYX00_007576 [Menopon gallinae]|uniref:Uncharacterized protein n=1 Tax=Menopon gallinae TaxID=328185 RepID=A0AAW2HJS8_9NEOP
MYSKILHLFLFACIVTVCNSLECFICENQEDNLSKCVKTISTCEQGEDMCLTEVKWGTMPYWQQGADKQYYISKKCATKSICEKARNRSMPYCTHIWYEDWKCTECCQGDRCNYYVILAGSTARSNFTIIVLSIITVLATKYFLKL